MKRYMVAVLFIIVLAFNALAHADDSTPVDLSDKKGVVDPQDLKKDNPKEPSLKTKEPPPPDTSDHYKVDVSGQDTKNYPPPSTGDDQ